MTDYREQLKSIRTFPSLVRFLRDELDWPVETEDFEDLTFDYSPEELGIDAANAAKIEEIKKLRPLVANQPWGIFFVKFEPKRLPVVALRRILAGLVVKKRATASAAEQPKWAEDDLLFISNYGEGDKRQITFAHFSQPETKDDLPTLNVLGWDNLDAPLHLDDVAERLTRDLAWPEDDSDIHAWRTKWSAAFTLRHREVITTSRQLSVRLAELARAIRDRIKTALAIEAENGPLTKLMKAFREALVHDLDADGFADMYAQTIAYGLLSARITDPERKTADDFAGHMRTNPLLRELMETFLKVGGRRGEADGQGIDFDELGVGEVVQLLDDANMEAVVLDFGDKNPLEDPVIHFYELFLREYDAKKRMQRGVFYTPRPVVSYIVGSVDELLRTEFGLEDGLADTTSWGDMAKRHEGLKIPESVPASQAFVQVLDPATGTGTFLVEVIDLIHKTLIAKWKVQGHDREAIERLWNDYVPQHLLTRLHGYELLMAPYAIAHLKFGLKLHETGYRFDSTERARIYLTNALEPAVDFSNQLAFAIPALAHEAQAVSAIKRDERFTVVVGNPPYSVKSYNNGDWIRSLLEDFKRGLNETKLNLDDDFIKFLRLTTHLAETTGVGVFSMVTNNIFLSGVTHRKIRRDLLDDFSRIRVTNLHGDTRYGEVAPDGSANENVFDIQQGVCVWKFVRPPRAGPPTLAYSDVWGSRPEKSARLAAGSIEHAPIIPNGPLWLFQPLDGGDTPEFGSWPSLADWMPLSSNGIETHKDGLTIQFTRKELDDVTQVLLSLPTEGARSELGVGDDGRDWHLENAVKSLREMVGRGQGATSITYRPFDLRYTMLNSESGGFIAYPRWDVMGHLLRVKGNIGLVSARLMARGGQWDSCLATRSPTEKKTGDSTRSSTMFPLFLATDALLARDGPHPNLAPRLVSEIRRLPFAPEPSADEYEEAHSVFGYLYALLHSSAYRDRYRDSLMSEFPRLPVPTGRELFTAISDFGRALVALHTFEASEMDGLTKAYIGPKNPEVGRIAWSGGTVWLDAPTTKKGQPVAPGTIGFHGVPEEVWNFHIGGYQVCHKWLKDRKGRALTPDDIAHYQKIVVALSETVRLMKEIDAVIEEHGGWPSAFVKSTSHAHV